MEKNKSQVRTWKVLFLIATCVATLLLFLYLATLQNSLKKSEEITLLRGALNDYGRSFSQFVQDNKVVDAKVEPSKLLENMTIDFDDSVFEISQGNYNLSPDQINSCEPEVVPGLSISLVKTEEKEYPEEIISIHDISLHSTNQSLIDRLMTGVGVEVESELRDVVVKGKRYSFVADHFAEGFPTNDDESCWAGGGYVQNRFILDEKLVVVLTTRESETGCEGEPEVITKTPDKKTIEAALRIIESINY